MGKVSSSLAQLTLVAVPAELKEHRDIKRIMSRWKMTDDELSYLYTQFCSMDKNGNGVMDEADFFSFLERDLQFRLQDTVYHLIVLEPDEPLTFPEWMRTVFSFCFQTKLETTEQVFLWFDAERSGKLSMANIQNLLISVHGDNALFCREMINQMQGVVEEKGTLEFDNFVKAVDRLPMLLWPIFKMQNQMRSNILGKLFSKLDRRPGDIEVFSGQGAVAGNANYMPHSGWSRKKEQLVTYLCGWPCCRLDTVESNEVLVEGGDSGGVFDFFQAGGDAEVDKELEAEMRKLRQQQALIELKDAIITAESTKFKDVIEDEYMVTKFWA